MVEFDIFNNISWDNNNGNYVGIGINGNVNIFNNVNELFWFNEGDVWNVLIIFDGISKFFDVFWFMEIDLMKGGSILWILDVVFILGLIDVFLGFIFGIGFYVSIYEIFLVMFINIFLILINIFVNVLVIFSLMMSVLVFLVFWRKK